MAGLELVDNYAQEFADLVVAIAHGLEMESSNAGPEHRKAILRRVERDVEEADEIMAQMQVELQSLDNALKPALSSKLKSFAAELAALKSQLRLAQNPSSCPLADPSLSLGVADPDDPSPSSRSQAQRQRLLRANQQLEAGSDRLDASHRMALETEELGTGILRDLRTQREQIHATRDTLRDADGHLDRASFTLNKMIQRIHRQRVVTGAIIIVLILLILLILYSKLS